MANISTSSVCAVCQGFGEEGHPRGRVVPQEENIERSYRYLYFHYPNLVVLSESARKGCRVCAFLLRVTKAGVANVDPYDYDESDDEESTDDFKTAWAEAEELERTRKDAFDIDRDTAEVARQSESVKDQDHYYHYLDALPRGSGRILLIAECFSPMGPRKENGERPLQIYVLASETDLSCHVSFLEAPAEPTGPNSPYGTAQNLLSEPYIALVRRWMDTCASKHDECRTHLGPVQKLPTRVLEILSDPATKNIKDVRLFETHGGEGTYACLSYCWGPTAQKSMTITSNFSQHLKSIPLNSLPRTIIDTLKVCCKLGFQYVWVDSLCIIQDDGKDWLREASNMAGVYSNATLTLAVHLCSDSSESFLEKLQQPEAEPLSDNATRLAFKDKTTGDERLLHLWTEGGEDAVRFLAGGWGYGHIDSVERRTSWLDRAWVLQEWLLSPRILHVHKMSLWDCFQGYGNELEHRFLTANPLPRAPSLLGANVVWYDVVQEFTRRKITKDTDRLPALAGLAEQYKKMTGNEYLAGMWVEDLPGTLLWKGPDRGLKSPTAYRAPSWSWASLEGEIKFELPMDETPEFNTSVVSAHCEYNPPGSLSTVTSGWLDVEGPVGLVSGVKKSDFSSRVFTNGRPVNGHDGWSASLDQDNTCSEGDVAQSKIYLLQIVVDSFPGNTSSLILEKVQPSGGKDTFRRIGYAMMSTSQRLKQERWEKRIIRLT
ncbi:hypothetical protein VM1G_04558 [Cytospora mali]|uniref:Heterokaryon incompatibility domain-containing protein n=1 Tax=Cytospora mali TaxID=578113 RepID=A0A194VXM8_CYTMA|nr:hypothetical protein VM1G_04558 [Valsa mali]